jgi:hypothetical protein
MHGAPEEPFGLALGFGVVHVLLFWACLSTSGFKVDEEVLGKLGRGDGFR